MFHQPGGFLTIHGDSAAIIKERSMRKAEQLRLTHELDVRSQGKDDSKEQDEVPIGSMRRTDQNIFGQVREFPVHAPAEQAHDESGQVVKDTAEDRRVEDCHLRSISFCTIHNPIL